MHYFYKYSRRFELLCTWQSVLMKKALSPVKPGTEFLFLFISLTQQPFINPMTYVIVASQLVLLSDLTDPGDPFHRFDDKNPSVSQEVFHCRRALPHNSRIKLMLFCKSLCISQFSPLFFSRKLPVSLERTVCFVSEHSCTFLTNCFHMTVLTVSSMFLRIVHFDWKISSFCYSHESTLVNSHFVTSKLMKATLVTFSNSQNKCDFVLKIVLGI